MSEYREKEVEEIGGMGWKIIKNGEEERIRVLERWKNRKIPLAAVMKFKDETAIGYVSSHPFNGSVEYVEIIVRKNPRGYYIVLESNRDDIKRRAINTGRDYEYIEWIYRNGENPFFITWIKFLDGKLDEEILQVVEIKIGKFSRYFILAVYRYKSDLIQELNLKGFRETLRRLQFVEFQMRWMDIRNLIIGGEAN